MICMRPLHNQGLPVLIHKKDSLSKPQIQDQLQLQGKSIAYSYGDESIG